MNEVKEVQDFSTLTQETKESFIGLKCVHTFRSNFKDDWEDTFTESLVVKLEFKRVFEIRRTDCL